MSEIWRPIAGYEGLYSVSSEGRLRRDTLTWRGSAGRILKQQPIARGKYLGVRLSKGNTVLNHRVATLVLMAFGDPKPTPAHTVNHKNCDVKDNRIENLEWVTDAENQAHALRSGVHVHAPDAHPKLVLEQVLEIRARRAAGETQRSIAESFGLTEKTIRLIEHRRTWKDVA